MASSMKWTTLGASTLSMSAQLDSIADEGNAAGSLITASQHMYSDWFLRVDQLAASARHLELYLVPNFSGSTAYGSSTIDPAPNLLTGAFPTAAAACPQNMLLSFVITPNRDFTPVIINKTGSAIGGSNNFLYFQMYNINPDA